MSRFSHLVIVADAPAVAAIALGVARRTFGDAVVVRASAPDPVALTRETERALRRRGIVVADVERLEGASFAGVDLVVCLDDVALDTVDPVERWWVNAPARGTHISADALDEVEAILEARMRSLEGTRAPSECPV